MVSFPHRDIHHHSYHIEINLYKIKFTRFFIKQIFTCCRNISCWKIDYTVIYHKNDYHDNLLPHLSWNRIYHFLCFIINTEPRDHRCPPAPRRGNRSKPEISPRFAIINFPGGVTYLFLTSPSLVSVLDRIENWSYFAKLENWRGENWQTRSCRVFANSNLRKIKIWS